MSYSNNNIPLGDYLRNKSDINNSFVDNNYNNDV